MKPGQIAGRPPSASQQNDIQFGWEIAREMGRLDIGQSVCVKDLAVLAVEAIEGTDACIHRAGELCPAGRVHDRQGRQAATGHAVRRADRRRPHAADDGRRRAQVLAIEAGRTILLDDAEFRAYAAEHKLSVVALADAAAAEIAA